MDDETRPALTASQSLVRRHEGAAMWVAENAPDEVLEYVDFALDALDAERTARREAERERDEAREDARHEAEGHDLCVQDCNALRDRVAELEAERGEAVRRINEVSARLLRATTGDDGGDRG